MKLSNVFYFKNIVDGYYPDENRNSIDTKSVVQVVQDDIKKLSDDDFCEVIISCFIPDLYSGMGKCEKLYTKLTELMVGEWWRRMGGNYRLPTKKSGTEDVELTYQNISIVCDAKVFRLGRSQKAPNVKDFLKLASVQLWINNLKNSYQLQKKDISVIGGLVTYSSLHEWESDSEVYEECTNHAIPVVMLPYEVLALLVKNKNRFCLTEFTRMWEYSANNVRTSRRKVNYWNYISTYICDLIGISKEEYRLAMKEYHRDILLAVVEYRRLVQENIDQSTRKIYQKMNEFTTMESLKEYAVQEIERRDNALALDYRKHIDIFRFYKDVDERKKGLD